MALPSDPISQNNSTPDTGNESGNQTNQAKPNIPLTLSVPSPPPTKTQCQITCKTDKGFWDNVKTAAEIIGIALLAVYTTYTIKLYRNAVDSERPWIGIWFEVKDWEVDKSPTAVAYFSNSGRRPAKVTLAQFYWGDFTVFTDRPYYPESVVKSVGILVPNQTGTSTQKLATLVQSRLQQLNSGDFGCFIYANVEYEDMVTHSIHWTHGCQQYLLALHDMPAKFVNCATYNEVDPD